jgi:zinc and cadmium transporter
LSFVGVVLLLAAAGGLLGALVASGFLMLPARARERAVPVLVAFAAGALLGAAFLELLPHAIEELDGQAAGSLGVVILLTLVVLFLLEKFLLWRAGRVRGSTRPAGTLILVSDAIHKFIDGVVIAAAAMTDPWLGVATAMAVMAHEVPHELSNIVVLLDSGFSRVTTFLLNVAASSTVLLGAITGLLWLSAVEVARPHVLGAAAAAFSYVALAELVPRLQASTRARVALMQSVLILMGAGVIYLVHHLAH